MQDNTHTFNDKGGVHPGAYRRRVPGQQRVSHQGYHHASAIAVKLRRLNNHDERNLVAQGTFVAMNIELRHYKNGLCAS